EIDIPGRWARQPIGIKFLGKRRIVAEFYRPDILATFYYAEKSLMPGSPDIAYIWQTFSSTKSPRDFGRELLPSELRRFRMIMEEYTDVNEFALLSARLRWLSSRLALQIAGWHAETNEEVNCVIVPQRRGDGWIMEEIGFRFPRDWHARLPAPNSGGGYMSLIEQMWNSLSWNTTLPPLYVPSKIRVS
ncbi:MAG: hypothetical protein ACRD3W_31860, partial [Terriglobales bacterium]